MCGLFIERKSLDWRMKKKYTMKRVLYLFLATVLLHIFGCHHSSVESSPEADGWLNDLDYAEVWMASQEHTYGYIGDDYQRFYICLDTIIKDKQAGSKYTTKGKWMFSSNLSFFDGVIEIERIEKEDVDSSSAFLEEPTRYIIHSRWKVTDRDTGDAIEGKMLSYCLYEDSIPLYYDDDFNSDGHCNNQFVGEYVSANKSVNKTCCWGTYRIPNCGDLDVGACEFIPNPRYAERGWKSYLDAVEKGTEEAWREELEFFMSIKRRNDNN